MSKKPSAEALEIAGRVNKLPAETQASIAEMARQATIADRLEAQRHCVFEIGAIVAVVKQTLNAFSGDEDALDIVEALSTQSYALEGAYRLSNQVSEELDAISREVKS